jgi:CelD/BcsL family acetyltransferase involved in cellulose biosynthesis
MTDTVTTTQAVAHDSPLHVTLSHDPAELRAPKADWEALQLNSANRCLYNSWEWTDLVWQHLCRDDELWLLTARNAHGALIGVTALMRHTFTPIRGTQWRQLSFVAAQLESDHLDFVCARGQELRIAQAFLAHIFAQRRRWDRLHLASLPQGSPTLAAIQPYLDPEQAQPQPEICPYISLPSDWETYYNTVLGQRKRKNYRRDQRRYAETFGEAWSWARVRQATELPIFFEALVELHQAKWTALGEQGAFGTPELRAFHRAVAVRFLELGWLRLYRLLIKGETVAVDYGFAYLGRYYAFAGGWDTRFAEYSVGDMLTGITIQEAIAEGLSEFDLHRGDQPYKYQWGAQNAYDQSVACLVSARARREQQLLAAARRAWQGVKHLLPSNVRRHLVRLLKRDLKSALIATLPALHEIAVLCNL